MIYLLPRDLAAELFGAERADTLETFAIQSGRGELAFLRKVDIREEIARVDTWLAENPHHLRPVPGLSDPHLEVVDNRPAARTRNAGTPGPGPEFTYLIPGALATRILGPNRRNHPRRHPREVRGRQLYRFTPNNTGYQDLRAWLAANPDHAVGDGQAYGLAGDARIIEEANDRVIVRAGENLANDTFVLLDPRIAREVDALDDATPISIDGVTLMRVSPHNRRVYNRLLDWRRTHTHAVGTPINARPQDTTPVIQRGATHPLRLNNPRVYHGQPTPATPDAAHRLTWQSRGVFYVPLPVAHDISPGLAAGNHPRVSLEIPGQNDVQAIRIADNAPGWDELLAWADNTPHRLSRPDYLQLPEGAYVVQTPAIQPVPDHPGGTRGPARGQPNPAFTYIMDRATAEALLGGEIADNLQTYLVPVRGGGTETYLAATHPDHRTHVVEQIRHMGYRFRALPMCPPDVRQVLRPTGATPPEQDHGPREPVPPRPEPGPEIPAERQPLDQGLRSIDGAFDQVLTSTAQRLRQRRGEIDQRLRRLNEESIRLMRERSGLQGQLDGLEQTDPRRAFREGLDRLLGDGTLTDAKAARAPYNRERTVIVLTTPELTCTRSSDGAKFDIGRFEILIDFIEGRVRFRNLDDKHPRWVHPHVERDGAACLGNAAEAIREMIASLEIVGLTGLLIDFLSNANADDPWGATVRQWPKTEDGDGNPVTPPCPEVNPDDPDGDEMDDPEEPDEE